MEEDDEISDNTSYFETISEDSYHTSYQRNPRFLSIVDVHDSMELTPLDNSKDKEASHNKVPKVKSREVKTYDQWRNRVKYIPIELAQTHVILYARLILHTYKNLF